MPCRLALCLALTASPLLAESPSEESQRYLLPGLDHGLMQSPVNIVTSQTVAAKDHKVVLHYEASQERVTNLGHTIEVEYDKGNTISFDGRTFDFKQFHFHTPSEHLIDGITYPLEMHMVHTLQDQAEGDTPVYLVVGVLFKEGAANPFLNEFIGAIPEQAGQTAAPVGGVVDINDLFALATDRSYYHYQGSLTTPPYTETVTWLVIKQVFEASPEQITRFNRLEGDNARHVQALYGREVDAN